MTGFLDRPGWWLPFFLFYFFFQFRFNTITWGICALPSLRSISNYFAFRHCLTSVKTQEIPSDLIIPSELEGEPASWAGPLPSPSSVSPISLALGSRPLFEANIGFSVVYHRFSLHYVFNPLDKKVKLASFQKKICLATRR